MKLKKIAIVATLIIVVTIIIVLKSQTAESKNETELNSNIGKNTVHLQSTNDNTISEELEGNYGKQSKEEQKNSNEIVKSESFKKKQKNTKQNVNFISPKATGNVLAIVEGQKITKKDLQKEYRILPKQNKDMFKNDKDLFLEQLITKKILEQKATQKGYIPNENSSKSQKKSGIQQLISERAEDIEIPETKLKKFYRENKSQMQDAAYEQVKNNIRNYLIQQKQNKLVKMYINRIRDEADVVLNEEWLAEQLAVKPKNPLTDALKNGLPTVLDLGSDSCRPCQMMMPIFDELETELEGKANIILLEIAEYRNLANKYKVRVIPTQIFFDQNGEQYWRHEGFLSKEDILKKLKETGAAL